MRSRCTLKGRLRYQRYWAVRLLNRQHPRNQNLKSLYQLSKPMANRVNLGLVYPPERTWLQDPNNPPISPEERQKMDQRYAPIERRVLEIRDGQYQPTEKILLELLVTKAGKHWRSRHSLTLPKAPNDDSANDYPRCVYCRAAQLHSQLSKEPVDDLRVRDGIWTNLNADPTLDMWSNQMNLQTPAWKLGQL